MRHTRLTVVALRMPTRRLVARTWRLAVAGLVQVLILSAPTLASAQQVTLKSKYEEGSQLVYRVTSRQNIQMPMGLGSQTVNQVETTRWTVLSVAPDGDATMQQRSQVFPTDPVGPNDAWQDSFGTTIPMFGTMTTNVIFVLEGVEQRDGRTVALISSTGEMVLGDALGPLAGLGEMDMETEMTGSMTFDVDRGITTVQHRHDRHGDVGRRSVDQHVDDQFGEPGIDRVYPGSVAREVA